MLSWCNEVLDCWVESACVPFAQYHYPFENSDKTFQSDVVIEASDQVRCWFYNLAVVNVALFDQMPYKNVICCGLILAEDGRKFSKRHGNGVSPMELCDEYTSDALRMYLTGSPAGHADSCQLETDVISELSSKFYQYLNAVKFFIEHTIKFGKDGNHVDIMAYKTSTNIMDRWILSRLGTTLKNIEEYMNKYHIYKVKQEILDFLEELINWYIKFNRNRLKGRYCNVNEQGQALSTLYNVIMQFTKICTPFMPFFCETIYQQLKVLLPDSEQELSIQLCSYPKVTEFPTDLVVERQMKNLQLVSRLVRSLRMKSKHSTSAKVPLKHVIVACLNQEFTDDIKALEQYILEEINAIKIIYMTSYAQNTCKLEPNFKELGLKYRKQSNDIKIKLLELSQDILQSYQKDQGLTIQLNGQSLVIHEPSFTIKQEQVLTLSPTEIGLVEDGVSIIVDFDQSNEVVELYTKRLFIVAVQKMRKNTKLRPWNRIGIYYETNSQLVKDTINKFNKEIEEELLYPVHNMQDRILTEKEIVSEKCDINSNEVTILITDMDGTFA